MKTGVILYNLGGPWSLKEVRPFLYRLFSDPKILVGVPTPLRQILAASIAGLKGKSSIQSYRKIGNGSPQLKWTLEQAQMTQVRLGYEKYRVVIGMRAAKPNIADALDDLRVWGADRVIGLPLFPHFSTTTTGSCVEETKRILIKKKWDVPFSYLNHWADHPLWIRFLKKVVDEEIDKARSLGIKDFHILFSAHSLPMKIVNNGDPYPGHVKRTIEAVTEDLKAPWSLAFQSRNGKVPWLKPYVDHEFARLAQSGIKNLIIIPVSFVSDHIETLYELDIEYAHLAHQLGIEYYSRGRVLNADPVFPELLCNLIESWKA